MTDEEARTAFADMDTDGSGSIDFEEAFTWWEAQDPEAQAALQESVKEMRHELNELAVREKSTTSGRELAAFVLPHAIAYESAMPSRIRRPHCACVWPLPRARRMNRIQLHWH